jgi:hypothetical protein
MAKLTPEERSELARKAALARYDPAEIELRERLRRIATPGRLRIRPSVETHRPAHRGRYGPRSPN